DTISREAMAVLQAYDFPGNMRELKNALEHAVILATGAEVRPDDLPKSMRPASFGARAPAPPSTPADGVAPLEEMRARWLAPLERQYLQDLLRRTNGHVTAAAKLAGVNRVTFYRLMERHGLRLARMPV
ncbi:MAG: sigma-54-dependent Fis family transcriptional regulator, partial [Myxococcaceae bacterium]|nr:sigma-54-dependent Fis family transcriptional regulator [Myxococcaceae bacterium]